MTDFDRFFQEQFILETFSDIFITSYDLKQIPPNLKLDKRDHIVMDEITGDNRIPGVYAGGDIVRGAATVILAMSDGRMASGAMQQYFMGGPADEPDNIDEEP